MSDVFNTLSVVDVNQHTEEKNGLTYLSWAWAWGEVKRQYPDSQYTIYENADGWNYHHDGRNAWVKTGVTIQGQEHIEYLPVLDYRNKSIPLDKLTSFDVNSAIQRSITKAIARHGLGLYIYQGEKVAPSKPKPASQVVGDRVMKAKQILDGCVTKDDDTSYELAMKVFRQAHEENLIQICDYALRLFPSIDIDSGVADMQEQEAM